MLAVVGGRKFNSYDVLSRSLRQWETDTDVKIHTIVSGGAPGADTLAARFARENELKLIEFKPYSSPGLTPLERNTLIVTKADYLIAFPTKESRGTWDSVRKAKARGIPVTVIKY